MSNPDRIVITREEAFQPKIDVAVQRARALARHRAPEERKLSPLQALLYWPFFYLPLAGLVGALAVWVLMEPMLNDLARVRGEVVLVNRDPFDVEGLSITVDETEVVVLDVTRLERGRRGEGALPGYYAIAPGDHVEAVGESDGGDRIFAVGLRPASPDARPYRADRSPLGFLLLFPLTAGALALALVVAEGLTSRNWLRLVERALLGTVLAVVGASVAFIPAIGFMFVADRAVQASLEEGQWFTIHDLPTSMFAIHVICRSCAWCCIGAALGAGMNLVRSTRAQLLNSVLGGALGGALGGMFFDPIGRFLQADSVFVDASLSRCVGLLAVGLCVGMFVALVETLSREAWLRVRSGPLAGKSFVLYRSPTIIGSAPEADIYLFKDPQIDPRHAAIHRIGTHYEIEHTGARHATEVNSERVGRRVLRSGDRIIVGQTILEFEERARQASAVRMARGAA